MFRIVFFGATCSAILTGLGILPTPTSDDLPDFSLAAVSLPEQPALLDDLAQVGVDLPELSKQVEERVLRVFSNPALDAPELPEAVDKAAVSTVSTDDGIVHFGLDLAELDTEAQAQLDKFSAMLLADETAKIEIFGHTDLTGAEDYNSLLGLRRANQVAMYLTENGISKDRIERIVSWGETSPVVETEAASRENRRVNIAIVHNI